MRHTTILLATAFLLAGAAVGCSSADETAKDCAAALTEKTGGKREDQPTVSEAKERVDAFDETLAGMVRSGYETVAQKAFDAAGEKIEAGGEDRPEACESLSEDDYTTLLTAKVIDGLGWTDEDGKFDKLKMAENLGD
ncbi:hypothetical protein PV733_07295 [Streptomyces europaeiscabiei]|uniref:hypothetical protein n=1 Tax=Streptomyces europaeiscabiei TaxID=146819 RepID=UPI0029A60285|nr:hypothetical protein [Streptomyces europaeiscabiei]MDX3708779.1 hypothetical protein [Streptomyces europaeiscabiei]